MHCSTALRPVALLSALNMTHSAPLTRCVFEDSVSSALLMRTRFDAKLTKALDGLPAKLFSISRTEVVPIYQPEQHDAPEDLIRAAAFTGRGDEETVPKLYRNYDKKIVDRIGDVREHVATIDIDEDSSHQLRRSQADRAGGFAVPYMLAVDQLLLLTDHSQGGSTKVAIVEAGHVQELISGASRGLSYDSCSQLALPFDRMDDSALKKVHEEADVLRKIGERLKKDESEIEQQDDEE